MALVSSFSVSAVLESIIAATDAAGVLSALVESFGSVFGANRALAFLFQGPGQYAPYEWCEDVPDPALDDALLFLAQHIARTCQSLTEPKVLHSADLPAQARKLRAENVLVTPLIAHGRGLGLLALFRAADDEPWSTVDEWRIADFSALAAIRLSQFDASAGSDPRKSHTPDVHAPLCECTLEGHVRSMTARYEEIIGLSGENLIGLNIDDLLARIVSPEECVRVQHAYRDAIIMEAAETVVAYPILTPMGGTRPILDCITIQHAGGTPIGFTSRLFDLSELALKSVLSSQEESRYRRLVEHSDAIILYTDSDFGIHFANQRALDFFGVAPEDFTSRKVVSWFDLVHPGDRNHVEKTAHDKLRHRSSFECEYRVINRISGRVRWILSKAVPVFEHGEVVAWDCFGVDITGRHEAQEALEAQSKKVRALYTVSAAIRGYLDPANIASRGLAALCDATGADAGLCYFYDRPGDDALQLRAHHGFSSEFTSREKQNAGLPGLAAYVSQNGQPIVVSDLRNDPRANKVFVEEEGLRSAVLVPICAENDILGAIGLLSRHIARFDAGDVMLVGAAANQIGLAARQAALFAAFRKQTKNLSALYRMSHELSQNLPTERIFQTAFEILDDELGFKRMWLGLLNETTSRIIGQAAYGPGWKRRLVEVNVELRDREHPIAEVVREKKPVVVSGAAELLREFGIRRVFSRMSIDRVVLVPIFSGGQVLGVLAVEPGTTDVADNDEQMTLVASLANEIGSAVLAQRLEERVAEADKMRTAGLLAAGVAHNFNNLLQAILGQASLLDMQSKNPEAVNKAARVISEAATRGAALVRQLLSFAHLEEPHREVGDMNAIIMRGEDYLKSLLHPGQTLTMNLGKNLPRGVVDPGQLIRIMAAIVANAADAMREDGRVEIFSTSAIVDKNSPHYEVPYGSYIRIGLRDNGRGMDKVTRQRCFEPFFTTKDPDPSTGLGLTGAGLGLAAAYALARRNGGRIVVDSRPGHGSLFTIYIRVAEEDLTRVLSAASPLPLALKVERVVVGDSEQDAPTDDVEKEESEEDQQIE